MTAVRRRLGIGVVGFGWMGQAHSRSWLRIPALFPDRPADIDLVACADPDEQRRRLASDAFGFTCTTGSWQEVVGRPDVDIVVVTAPNALHLPVIEAATAAGHHVFCEKPVGGTPSQTARAERLGRYAGVVTGVGYNYRWLPLVLEARRLIADGTLGQITNYCGRFFSCYGADPLGAISWRYRLKEGGYGVTSDLLSHAVDLASFLVGALQEVIGVTDTFIGRRPIPASGGTHYQTGDPDGPTEEVTNEDYCALLGVFASGARASFEASRTMVGPESQMAFEVYGTEGAVAWNLERLNELRLYLRSDGRHAGWRTVNAGERFAYHGHFAPGQANGIGFEDAVVIEDLEFARSVCSGRPYHPGFDAALAYGGVQEALVRSTRSGRWEPVVSLREA